MKMIKLILILMFIVSCFVFFVNTESTAKLSIEKEMWKLVPSDDSRPLERPITAAGKNGVRVAFSFENQQGLFVHIDGSFLGPFTRIAERSLIFSDHAESFAFIASSQGKKMRMNINVIVQSDDGKTLKWNF